MREMILQALKTKLLGEMNGHIANIEVMMTNPVGVGDHPTIIDTIDKELAALENANGKLKRTSKSTLKGDKRMQHRKKRNPNLSKYDAPLRIQFERGFNAFKGRQYVKTVKGNKVIMTENPL